MQTEIKFTLEQVNYILAEIGKLPYHSVAHVVRLIQTLASEQVNQEQKPQETGDA